MGHVEWSGRRGTSSGAGLVELTGRSPRSGATNKGVTSVCQGVRQSVSARLDGESGALSVESVEAHLEGCVACRNWSDAAAVVTMKFRVQPVGEPVTAPPAVRAAASRARGGARPWLLPAARAGLAALGVTQLVVTMHLLVSGDIDGFRDLGALDVAIGFGFLVAAGRPFRAAGMRSIVGAAAVLLTGSAALDLLAHRTTLWDESPHLIVVAGWLLICAVAARTPERGTSPSLRWRDRFGRTRLVVMGSGPCPEELEPWTWDDGGDSTVVAEARAVRRASEAREDRAAPDEGLARAVGE